MWSTKCPVREMSVRGNALVGKYPVGEVSFGEVSGREIVHSGKCPLGKFLSGKCKSGNCPRVSVNRGTVRIPSTTTIIYEYCNLVVESDLFTAIYFLQILIKP